MKSLKRILAELVRELPDDCDWRLVYCRLYVARKLDAAVEASNRKREHTIDEARRMLAERARVRWRTTEHLKAMKAWLDRCESYD